MKFRKIMNSEQEIRGEWVLIQGNVQANESCQRIEWLISEYLIKLATDGSGWEHLYFDQEDGRYWELTYPNSESHGGGAPLLKCISKHEANMKYKIQ